MRIVADTNILIASIFWNGAPTQVVQKAIDKEIEILTSQEILNEVRKTLKNPKEKFALSEQEIDDIINSILLYAKIIKPLKAVNVVRDSSDNHIIECAVEGNANHIVTRDKDLLVLKEYNKIKIILPEEFLNMTN